MGEIVNRTYRRSAETTGVTVRVTPLGKGAGVGTKATDPGPTIGVNAATYHCNWALTIVAAAPLKVVTLGAWRTLARVSPWAAVRKKYISTSLRKAIPNVPPEPGIALVGAIRPPWGTIVRDHQVIGEVLQASSRRAHDERGLVGIGVVADWVDQVGRGRGADT